MFILEDHFKSDDSTPSDDGPGTPTYSPVVTILIGYVIPIIGGILSVWMSASATPALRLAEKAKDIGTFNPIPNIIFFHLGFLWISYSIMILDPFVFFPNAFNVLINMNIIFRCYAIAPRKIQKRMMIIIEVGMLFSFALASLLIFLSSTNPGIMVGIGGWVCLVANVLLYIAPLSRMVTIIKDRDSSSINLAYIFAQFVCSFFWFVYGLYVQLIAIYIPNAFGIVVAVLLILLRIILPSKMQVVGTTDLNTKLIDRHSIPRVSTSNQSAQSVTPSVNTMTARKVRLIQDGEYYNQIANDEHVKSIYNIEGKATTTPLVDRILDRTAEKIEMSMNKMRPLVVSNRPKDVLEEEYNLIIKGTFDTKDHVLEHSSVQSGASSSQYM